METIKFRQAAIDHATSLTRLDYMIRITSPYLWVMMAGIYLLLIGVIIWSFYGTVHTYVRGQGILLAGGGNLYNAVAPQSQGHLKNFVVMTGDRVKKDQVIAYIDQPDQSEQIRVQQAHLNDLIGNYNQQLATAKQQIAQHQQNINAQNSVLRDIIATEQKNLASIQEFLKIQQVSYQRGLDTKERLVGTLQQFYQSQQSIDNSRQRITQNAIDQAAYVDQWRQRLHDLNLNIENEKYKLRDLRVQFKIGDAIKSPVDGIVVDLQASIGTELHEGDPVASISSVASELDAMLYVSPTDGKRVESNMQALVSPGTVKKEEYGSIRGKVISVSRFPVSQQSMQAMLQNPKLIEMFSATGAPIAVRVSLKKDAATFSGFNWTSSQGPKQSVTPGTLVTAEITVQKTRPVTLVIPAFKKLMGIE